MVILGEVLVVGGSALDEKLRPAFSDFGFEPSHSSRDRSLFSIRCLSWAVTSSTTRFSPAPLAAMKCALQILTVISSSTRRMELVVSRILNEGEVFVPAAFRRHVEGFGAGYLRALRRAKLRGELHDFADEELEPIAYILLAARSYLSFRYASVASATKARVPDYVLTAYMKLLRHGLFIDPPTHRKSDRLASKKNRDEAAADEPR